MTVRLNRYAFGALVVGAAALGLVGCSSDETSSSATVDSGSGDAGGGDSASSGTGPGATLKCDSSGKNAWETYGVSAFVAVNEAIFANVIAEGSASGTTNVGDSFTKIGSGNPASTADDLPTFKGNLAAFLVYAYGGPGEITYTDNKKYTGPQDMVESHTGLGITGAQYDYFVSNIVVPALTKNGVKAGKGGAADPNDVSSCFAPILVDAAFKASIVGQ
jgi:hypothetical protein